MSSELIFDEEEHKYTVGERVLPSVTGLMGDFGIVNTEWYGYQARVRGTHVHKATEYYDEGDLNYEALDPIVKPFVDAYIKFSKESGVTLEHSELRMYDHLNWYAGTLDRTGFINGKRILFDIKTGTMPNWVHIQLAAYKRLLECHERRLGIYKPVMEFYALQLRKDGTYRFNSIPIKKIHEGQKLVDSMVTINNFKRITIGEKYE